MGNYPFPGISFVLIIMVILGGLTLGQMRTGFIGVFQDWLLFFSLTGFFGGWILVLWFIFRSASK